MPSLLTGAALGLLSAIIAGISGASWGQILLTYITVGAVMTLASALVLMRHAQKTADPVSFADHGAHGDGQEGHRFERVRDRIG